MTEANKTSTQVLTFGVAGEKYGVDALNVRELRRWGGATRIPLSEAWVIGVINVRGEVVPVVDLRARLGLDSIEFTTTTVVILVALEQESGTRQVGLIVEQVDDVTELDEAEIRPSDGHPLVKHIVVQESGIVLMLDVPALVADVRFDTIERSEPAPAAI